jgi:hypothetical protein
MSALDTDNFNGGWFALNHEPRPVAIAMRQLIQLLSGATNLEVILEGSAAKREGPYAYRFTTPRGHVTAAWCQSPVTLKIPVDPNTETLVTDMLGNNIAKVKADSYVASLSETPIFLTSNSTAN